jgi:hypothetical protein
VGFSFNNETFPGSATSGLQFAMPSFPDCRIAEPRCVGKLSSVPRRLR